MLSDDDRLILRILAKDGARVAARVAQELGITRQAASAKLSRLRQKGLVLTTGHGAGTHYALVTIAEHHAVYKRDGLQEDVVWSEFFAPILSGLPKNVLHIWQYAVTEMINNAIDHSGAETVFVDVRRTAINTEIAIFDDGEGIFLKIQRALGLADPRMSILELAKGKLTTDPAHHTGEGIFFSSKVVDAFDIRSGRLHFMHSDGLDDWLVERTSDAHGTQVLMRLADDSPRRQKDVFDRFAMPDEYTFAKTIVPVRLAQHEGEFLVSRSQARRLTARFERFQTVVLDFEGVSEIGQAFADEVFRVFQTRHPGTALTPVNMTADVERMIQRALA